MKFSLLALAATASAKYLATTTRYYDGQKGACGCGTSSGIYSWQLGIGTAVYTAAGSQALFDTDDATWCGGGCGKCYNLTATGPSACDSCGSGETAGTSIIVMVTNLCPYNGNEVWCPSVGAVNDYGYSYHFDIMAESEVFGDNAVVEFEPVTCPGAATTDFEQCECYGELETDTTPAGMTSSSSDSTASSGTTSSASTKSTSTTSKTSLSSISTSASSSSVTIPTTMLVSTLKSTSTKKSSTEVPATVAQATKTSETLAATTVAASTSKASAAVAAGYQTSVGVVSKSSKSTATAVTAKTSAAATTAATFTAPTVQACPAQVVTHTVWV